MEQFSNSQIQAIHHGDGPMMVLAGPGSGKTLVITHRVKNLIEEYGISPGNILVITFTRAAAVEMQERFEKLTGNQKAPVSFGTFHAVFFKILKYAYNYSSENILREEMKYRIIRDIVDKLQLEYEDENEFISGILGEISCVKGDMISIEHYYSQSCSDSVFKNIYRKYNDKLRNLNKVDFDDMLVMCYELLSGRRDILQAWQNKYRYILIDEFQDINRVQYEVIKLLTGANKNIFIVGDDDQSIYGFRGAKPEIMLNFENDFPGTIPIVLEENYRSVEKIVEASTRLISVNSKRFFKEIHGVREKGDQVDIRNFKSHADEGKYIVDLIRKYVTVGVDLSDIAIICRTNMGPGFMVQKLMEYNIAFKMKDAIPNIYDHWVSKNIISYIRIALGDRSRGEFLQIMNKPKRYISRDSLAGMEIDLEELKNQYKDREWMVERISRLQYDLDMISGLNPYSAISYIYNAVGYKEYLKEYAEYRRINPQELYDVVFEMQELAKPFSTYQEWFDHMKLYAEQLEKQSKNIMNQREGVEIVTMHGSKGLQYKIVIIPDVNEKITPHKKAILDDDIEEERRVFYVAMTRAMDKLHILSVDELYGKKVEISRFVNEMQTPVGVFVEGQIVKHLQYGEGTVKCVKGGRVSVMFRGRNQMKTFDIKYAIDNKLFEI